MSYFKSTGLSVTEYLETVNNQKRRKLKIPWNPTTQKPPGNILLYFLAAASVWSLEVTA